MKPASYSLSWVNSSRFENLSIGVIGANALILALETMAVAPWYTYLVIADKLCLLFFVTEIGLRITATHHMLNSKSWYSTLSHFFKDGWHVFDFIAILCSFIPGLGALRTLRLLRLVAKLHAFRGPVEDLLHACRSSWQLFCLAFFLTFLGALTGTLAFQTKLPDLFGNLTIAMITCYSMMFGDNVSGNLSAMAEHNLILTMVFACFVMLMHGLILALVVSLVVDMAQQRRGNTP